jgi:hypothetical protein
MRYALLLAFFLLTPVFLNPFSTFADGPVEPGQQNPYLHKRERDGGSFTKKPEVVISTVGPVPVNPPPNPPVAGAIDPRNVNVVVAPPVGRDPSNRYSPNRYSPNRDPRINPETTSPQNPPARLDNGLSPE